jgi:hypothetical protein
MNAPRDGPHYLPESGVVNLLDRALRRYLNADMPRSPTSIARNHYMHRRLLLGLLAVAVLAGAVLLGLTWDRRPVHDLAAARADAVLQSMKAILRREGLAAALDSLALRAARDSALHRDGHQMAHILGREAAAGHEGDATIIRECRPVFASGCYHGVVEASLQAAGRIDVPDLERLCVAVDGSGGPGSGFECIHGLGHGILGALRYDLEAALRDCDALSTPRRAASCHSGAFMEAISSAVEAPAMHGAHAHATTDENQQVRPLVIDAADPYSPCRSYGDPYATSCWLFQGFVILRANGFDARRALQVCDGAPGVRATRCYEGVGHQLTGLFQRGDRWILDQCAMGQALLASPCAAGAALALDAIDWSGFRAARLCAGAPEEWKETCYRSASGALVDLALPTQRARLCAAVERVYVGSCRQAGELVTASTSQ